MKKITKLIACISLVLLFGIMFMGCGGEPTINVNTAGLTSLRVTPNATENELGQITEPGFSSANLPYVIVSVTKGSADYTNVRITAETDASIQVIAQDETEIYKNVATTGWGTAEGEALATNARTFYLVASREGRYDLIVKVIDVANGNATIAQNIKNITVQAAS